MSSYPASSDKQVANDQLDHRPKVLSQLPSPSFVVNLRTFINNCREVHNAITSYSDSECTSSSSAPALSSSRTTSLPRRQIKLRPHVKTHKCKEGAFIQAFLRHSAPLRSDTSSSDGNDDRDSHTTASAGLVAGFVASTIPEMEMLYECAKESKTVKPFGNIVYGIPISRSKIQRIIELKQRFEDLQEQAHFKSDACDNDVELHVLVDNIGQVQMLNEFSSEERKLSVYLKVDTGYHRAGVSINEDGVDLACTIIDSNYLSLKGLYSHCGHAYDVSKKEELEQIINLDHSRIVQFLNMLQQKLSTSKPCDISSKIVSALDISVGSTPSVFMHHKNNVFNNIANQIEVHPGNYVFYDRQQLWTGGSCSTEKQIAVRVLSRVISHYPDRNVMLLDAGALALTKDSSPQGGVCSIEGHPKLECYKMSQEVIMVRPKEAKTKFPFQVFPLEKEVFLVPNHSCLAAACFDRYFVVDNDTGTFDANEEIIEEWFPYKGW
mmetsp:Transcript_9303/g.13836  ORF Transcript_9303/g.13836 Transcript_9303/m.13836 type:complete len:493 (-) Transcript_9303:74-1552(-)